MATSQTDRLGTSPSGGVKTPCRAVATSNLTLSGVQTVDTVDLAVGDRVLVAGQDDATENGIYVVASGSWERATDWNASNDVLAGMLVANSEGSSGAQLRMVTFSGTFTLGSTEPSFTVIS